MEPRLLKQLEDSVQMLLAQNKALKDDNAYLRACQAELEQERDTLLNKNQKALAKVNLMLKRLQQLEPQHVS